MKKNSGQALVEFIIVMPVFLLILISIIDYGNIIYQKYQLENTLDNIVDLYNNQKNNEIDNIIRDKKLEMNVSEVNNETTIKISKKVKVSSPGINVILGNPYKIIVERVVYSEK